MKADEREKHLQPIRTHQTTKLQLTVIINRTLSL